ncbi:DNA mismatch repair protein MutT [Spongiactinospora gelatinilytica]|uniref:DNA mismatch repair protein MutT n=1 Tax=Spongiactinospora gelatinilytica TaxID=2666298 RepID=A0A2W2GFH1_9ACTN|nr:NUDIX domain-containing protein [Spongiactinospora gelatinilytica]PZG46572.1 DNA mismatch repair protein MutT [Spongiactinospora gelatinilytica]
MARIDYYDDPNAPEPKSVVPGGSAVVVDDGGRVLLHRRRDSGLWALPGGVMDLGESITEAVIREVAEETGVIVEVTGLVGVYSDPRHVIAYSDGEVRQQSNVCLRARPVGGTAHVTDEAREVRWVIPDDIDTLETHPTQRLRIRHALDSARSSPYLG